MRKILKLFREDAFLVHFISLKGKIKKILILCKKVEKILLLFQ